LPFEYKGVVMNKIRAVFLTVSLLIVGSLYSLSLSKGTDELNEHLYLLSDSSQKIPVLIVMKDRVDSKLLYQTVKDLGKKERREYTISTLRAKSEETQADIKLFLEKKLDKKEADSIKYLWLNNTIGLNASLTALLALNERDDIEYIDYDPLKPIFDDPVPNTTLYPEKERGVTYGLRLMKVPEVWELGYKGAGVLVGVLDTGVNYNHKDIVNRMWVHQDYPNHGYNFKDDDDNPTDLDGHGTHCAGIVAGDGTSGTQSGVAPEAEIMALRISNPNDVDSNRTIVWSAIQFGLFHGVYIFTMSFGWVNVSPEERALWREVLEHLLSASVVLTGSAGNRWREANQFPIPNNITIPKDCPPPWLGPEQDEHGGVSGIISVAAIDNLDRIATFSSRGPVTWQNVEPYFDYKYKPGEGLTKPDISAPGVDVWSLCHENNDEYVPKSGTSMAAPAVAGAIALLLSKNPNLTPEKICQLLEEGVDRLSDKKDNTFGSGRVNILNSINNVVVDTPPNQAKTPAPFDGENDVYTDSSFKWYDGGGADEYLFSFGTDNPPTNILSRVLVDKSSFELDSLLEHSTDYYWQINSLNEYGETEGKIWSFRTGYEVSIDFEEGELPGYEWSFYKSGAGAEDWYVSDNYSNSGQYSLQSGAINHNSSTSILLYIDVLEPGIITFYRKISSEMNDDYLRFYIDGELCDTWSGESDWERVSYPVQAGIRSFRWSYSKGAMDVSGEDAAWIDDITFPKHYSPPIMYAPHSLDYDIGLCNVELTWQIEKNEHYDPIQFSFLGFDVYRSVNSRDEYIKVNGELVNEPLFNEQIEQLGEHSYYVVALYRKLGQVKISEPTSCVSFTIDGKVEIPIYSHPEGEYNESIQVEITSHDEEAVLFYTLDGNDPTTESNLYTEPILIDQSLTLKSKGYKLGLLPSEISSAQYTLNTTAAQKDVLPLTFQTVVYPNPFIVGHSTTRSSSNIFIDYSLPKDYESLQVSIYNIKGQLIKEFDNPMKRKGEHQLVWELKQNIGSGLYFIDIHCDNKHNVMKLMVIK